MAAKIIIKIPHIIWRNGEPRFMASPRLRRLGFKGHNLKHPNGEWFDIIETQTFSKKISQQANERQAQVKDGKRLRAVPEMLTALKAAHQFITNGIETGNITIKDPDDPANKTLPMIAAALFLAEGGDNE